MAERLSPERAVRLLRAKAAELESRFRAEIAALDPDHDEWEPTASLVADIALIAGLLADHIERSPGPSGPELGEAI